MPYLPFQSGLEGILVWCAAGNPPAPPSASSWWLESVSLGASLLCGSQPVTSSLPPGLLLRCDGAQLPIFSPSRTPACHLRRLRLPEVSMYNQLPSFGSVFVGSCRQKGLRPRKSFYQSCVCFSPSKIFLKPYSQSSLSSSPPSLGIYPVTPLRLSF